MCRMANFTQKQCTYVAIDAELAAVREHGDLPVPLHIRNAPTKLMKNMDYGKIINIHTATKEILRHKYLPAELSGTKFFGPAKCT